MPDKKWNLSFQSKILFLLILFCCASSLPQAVFALPANTILPTFNVTASSLERPQTAGYQYLGHAQGQGAIQNSMVGPGQSASHQLYYVTYTYINGTMDLVAIDPNTGQDRVYPSPVSSEEAAWALTVGADHNMYLGSLPNAHVLKFDITQGKLIDIGQAPRDPKSGAAQSYIWQVTTSPYNHKVYGCTYPSADLISYDPLDPYPQLLNLGSMDPAYQEQYARFCIADPDPNSPYIYVGLGSVSSRVIAYNVATNSITPLITASSAGIAWVYLGLDSAIHAEVCGTSPCQYYKLSEGDYTQINSYVPPAATNILNDGGTIQVRVPASFRTPTRGGISLSSVSRQDRMVRFTEEQYCHMISSTLILPIPRQEW